MTSNDSIPAIKVLTQDEEHIQVKEADLGRCSIRNNNFGLSWLSNISSSFLTILDPPLLAYISEQLFNLQPCCAFYKCAYSCIISCVYTQFNFMIPNISIFALSL